MSTIYLRIKDNIVENKSTSDTIPVDNSEYIHKLSSEHSGAGIGSRYFSGSDSFQDRFSGNITPQPTNEFIKAEYIHTSSLSLHVKFNDTPSTFNASYIEATNATISNFSSTDKGGTFDLIVSNDITGSEEEELITVSLVKPVTTTDHPQQVALCENLELKFTGSLIF